MPTTTDSKSVKNLRNQVTAQKEQINALLMRVSSLSDKIVTIQNEIKHFKTHVASDVKYLTERVDS